MICLARDKVVRELCCNMAQRKICAIITFQQVVKNQRAKWEFSTKTAKIKQRIFFNVVLIDAKLIPLQKKK